MRAVVARVPLVGWVLLTAVLVYGSTAHWRALDDQWCVIFPHFVVCDAGQARE